MAKKRKRKSRDQAEAAWIEAAIAGEWAFVPKRLVAAFRKRGWEVVADAEAKRPISVGVLMP